MGNVIDLSGQTFGKLTVIRQIGITKFKSALWECRCDCGHVINVNSNALRTGHTKSCGCARADSTSAWMKRYNTKHNGAGSRLYVVWKGIKQRTSNPNNCRYASYGGRGIKLCDEWQDFNAFREWAEANGYDANAPYGVCTIDRIDVDGNYEPGNCRWVGIDVQAKNKRKAGKACKQDIST